jgi:hypothetical protein
LLKNSVPVPEYVLLTDPVLEGLSPAVRAHASPLEEDLEGIGATSVHYVDLEKIARDLPPELAPSTPRKWWRWLQLTFRALPYMLGLKEPCDGFRNMDGMVQAPSAPALPSGEPEARVQKN